MRRLLWFATGAATGVAVMRNTGRRLRRTAKRLAPANVGRAAVDSARRRVDGVRSAVAEGRAAKRNTEAALAARLDGRVEPLADHIEPGDRVLVDGEPVDKNRVVVLRERASRD